MPYTGSPPSFTAGEKTGVAAKLNQLRDAIRGFTDPWTAYTPTLTASTTNPTGWTTTGYYCQVGKLVVCKFRVMAGASMTTGTGTYRVALPVAANTSSVPDVDAGIVVGYDASPGNFAMFNAYVTNASYVQFGYAATHLGAFTAVGNASPWTWANTDFIRGTLTYEAA